MSIKKIFSFVPNTITSMNILSGSLSIVFAFEGNLILAGLLILIASVFDFFDGMSARLLGAYSDMGKELDSLADMVSFGLAPSVIAFQIVRKQYVPELEISELNILQLIVIFTPFLMTIFSGLRLAKFNIDTRQTSSFIGLPTPANAMIWASFPFIMKFYTESFTMNIINNVWIVLGLCILMSLLLTAELPLFSLKFKNLKWRDNKTVFIFLIISLALILVLQLVAFPIIILVYVVISIIENISKSKYKAE